MVNYTIKYNSIDQAVEIMQFLLSYKYKKTKGGFSSTEQPPGFILVFKDRTFGFYKDYPKDDYISWPDGIFTIINIDPNPLEEYLHHSSWVAPVAPSISSGHQVRKLTEVLYGEDAPIIENWRPARPQEVKSYLSSEAKRRGYHKGVKVLGTSWSTFPGPMMEIPNERIIYFPHPDDKLFMGDKIKILIYRQGDWAKIYKPPKIDLWKH